MTATTHLYQAPCASFSSSLSIKPKTEFVKVSKEHTTSTCEQNFLATRTKLQHEKYAAAVAAAAAAVSEPTLSDTAAAAVSEPTLSDDESSCDSTDSDDDSSIAYSVSYEIETDLFPTQQKKSSKRVSFAQCEIREYSVVVGDHPRCKRGLPIALGWNHSGEDSYTVDDYETIRGPFRRTHLYQLKLTATERRYRLREVSGLTDDVLDRMEELVRIQRQTRKARASMQSFKA
eukprot:CAMPEP_0118723054 /NCGR_PEP_ID=MMETSP0800-20121206/31776_1 /TAXON_ID=210618 ORGANISM="Striatella unipunctata, Strain CCMP2910" /NCGR_SAMPLE_ID=MMETSP0800 /ASSEMBLY_ACC=CAM_ASM_000638 /LENGTH=231 /DNA_ID=CAMNT_0006631409 /DNA_START=12 /DNA_END=704 /DNA_ORIENTATION=+